MRGLLRNNIYSMESNIKMSVAISLFLMAVTWLVRGQVVSMLLAMQIFIFIANMSTSLQVDENSRWAKFELTLPVRRSAIIEAKYLSFLFLILLGIITSIPTCVGLVLMGRESYLPQIIYGYEFGISLAVITVALLYPPLLKLGAGKSELLFCLGAVGAVLLMGIVSTAVFIVKTFMIKNLEPGYSLAGVSTVVFGFGLLALSFLISRRIYEKKEF